ncbi:MAG: glycoside hydrolase family 38 C-terminal domain-containing protein [Bacteroidota bacterium]
MFLRVFNHCRSKPLVVSSCFLALLFGLIVIKSKAASNAGNTLAVDVQPYYKYRKDGGAGREIVIQVPGSTLKGNVRVMVQCDGTTEASEFVLDQPVAHVAVLLPEGVGVKTAALAQVSLYCQGKAFTASVAIPVKKQWTVYIYPHSHVDIGYTNLQDSVRKLQVRNIDVGIDLAEKTQHYPEGARFIWNTEATWVVAEYLARATPRQKVRFYNAVKKGWLQIDGGHSNINTSTCSDEELQMMFSNKRIIEKQTKVPIRTMVQMDLPGAAWGLVAAAKQSGIDGFISFPNYFDLRKVWDHQPFYWLGPDGKSRILFLQGSPYGYGYTVKGSKYGLKLLQTYSAAIDRVSTNNPSANFIDPFIFRETDRLEREGSPYAIYAMTWSMADNCLIDADLPEAVRLWNQKYAYPKVIIAGSRDILDAFKKRYAAIIPEYSGDMTEFWTEGLGSDARRVGMGRRAKENLVQAEMLWPMLNGAGRRAPLNKYKACWEQLLLSAEHTWGYQNPAAPLAKQVEANKAAYFENAEKQSNTLIDAALTNVKKIDGGYITVFNTLAWVRGGLVKLSDSLSRGGNRVITKNGTEMPAQRLSTGELLFYAEKLPALGCKTFKVIPGIYQGTGDLKAGAGYLSNNELKVTLDKKTGNITSLLRFKDKREFVNTASGFDLNSYNYVKGVRNGKDTVTAPTHATQVTIQIKEKGPLLISLSVRSDAEGCKWLNREIKLYQNRPYLEIVNTVNKIATRQKEGIHFGFGFNVPEGITHMDIPLGVMQPGRDQLKGTNKNWLTFQRWIDVSNKNAGITFTSVEAPIVEFGSLTGNILDGARQGPLWAKDIQQTQTIISWLLNNHWDTNFPLEQGGEIASSYGILLHGAYDAVTANHFGVEFNRPLIAIATNGEIKVNKLVTIDNPKVMLAFCPQSNDSKQLQINLRSLSAQPEKVTLQWKDGTKKVLNIAPYGSESLTK